MMDPDDDCHSFLDEIGEDFLGISAVDSYETYLSSQEDCMNLLNRVDYSLNSPLVIDEVREFTKYCQGLPFDKRWNMKLWTLRKKAFSSVETLRSPDSFHKWFGHTNISIKPSLDRITKLLVTTDLDATKTYNVVSAFFKGWLNKDIQNTKTANIPLDIKKWGALFLDLHFIILLMNASTIKEIQNLSSLISLKKVPEVLKDPIIYDSPVYGEIIISLGFACFSRHNRVLDRTSVLLMKDVYNSRFHSLLSMIDRYDNKYRDSDWIKLNKLYYIGDSILSKVGNQGYSSLKLLEPICNNKLMKLAHKHRSKIEYYDNFEKHILNSVKEQSVVNPLIYDFYQHVNDENSVDMLLAYYGSFRHWGHPYVNSLIGIKKLYDRVTEKIEIDVEYAEALASDLARKVLEIKFKEHGKWYVDISQLNEKHSMYDHIKYNTWPTPKMILDFGDHWHQLPLVKCFDIPDLIDPSQIYSDKSHSMNRDEVFEWISKNKPGSIPTKKVLETMINSPATNWRDFLQKVNDYGLELNELIIGLKEKERELKEDGRFYSLMSWALREYFVITEYLIKIFYVPLFKGLTVADDMTTLLKKLMDNSSGQGLNDYSRVSYANHLDYEKWNNYQRIESNGPVFTVMGQFMGYPKLIYRTHEFFQNSLVYYTQRPDLMTVHNDELLNKTDQIVSWNGQVGGFEGIRQKGWSILNALSVEREGRNLNTKVTLLAQGDNQIICTNYKLQASRDDSELEANLLRIKLNNDKIMSSIDSGVTKLGLRINKDETMQSADFLSYGKVPIYRGNIRPLEEKRWSRCSCVTNDQLPTLGNVISSVSSNALTISHFSSSPLNTIIHYNFVGNFIRNLIDLHNPATRDSIKIIKDYNKEDARLSYLIKALYLDPCLGGVSGMSLTRFLIRMFPDPVCESLSFWKIVYHNISYEFKNLITSIGSCRIAKLTLENFSKLIENPLSLNLKNTVSPISQIKDVIRKSLYDQGSNIPNLIVRDAILYSKEHFDIVNSYLLSIDPLFPRFISEFRSSTYLGITESMIGLFENSKTIRNVFKRRMLVEIDNIIITSEIQSITAMHNTDWKLYSSPIWECSANHADALRFESWGRTVIGATVPHPIELLHCDSYDGVSCTSCDKNEGETGHLITLVPSGLSDYMSSRGPYMAYLGSRTSETTSIIQPWERETKLPIIKRASKLRNVIHWFVEPNSNLALSILSIPKGLTGESWDTGNLGFKRTGCGPHRYACSRQSAGGYSAQSPAKLTRMTTTTDTMDNINEDNHDFMYQSLIIYSQITVGELHDLIPSSGIYHSHIKCKSCIRKVENPLLDSPNIFLHPDVSESLSKWKPEGSAWAETKLVINLPLGKWDELLDTEKSYHIGRIQGFVFGDSLLSHSTIVEQTALFPLGIANKVTPRDFLNGLLDGLIRIGSLYSLSRRSVMELKKPRPTLLGVVLYLIESLSLDPAAINIWRNHNFIREFSNQPHRIPASYPLTNFDLGSLGRYYLKLLFKKNCMTNEKYYPEHKTIWIFSDVNDIRIVGPLLLSKNIAQILYSKALKSVKTDQLRAFKEILTAYRDPQSLEICRDLESSKELIRVDSEVRHAAKDMIPKDISFPGSLIDWTTEDYGQIYAADVNYTVQPENQPTPTVPRIQDPLISGMRLFQCASGSHYKIRSIIKGMDIEYKDALCGGDGSGGIGSWILRNNRETRLIFNSLLDMEGVVLKGSSPSGPAAIELIPEISHRCINLTDSWKHPNDLAEYGTWNYFKQLKIKHHLDLSIIIFDMEVKNQEMMKQIILRLSENICDLLTKTGTLIFKTFLKSLLYDRVNILNSVGIYFQSVKLVWTEFSSSHTSEIYVVMQNITDKNIGLKPCLSNISNFINNLPVFRSNELEFSRAIKLKYHNFLKGVPCRYHSDPFVSLSTLLMTLGVSSGVSGLLGEMVKYPTRIYTPNEYLLTIIYVSINSILGLTRGYLTTVPIPTDAEVSNLGILMIGFSYWLGLSTENIEYYNWSLNAIKYYMPFSWTIVQVKNLFYRKISITGEFKNTKNFHYDKEMSRIGQVIRILTQLFRVKYKHPLASKIDQNLKEFDVGLDFKKIDLLTDLNRFIENPTFSSQQRDHQILCTIVESYEESSYTN